MNSDETPSLKSPIPSESTQAKENESIAPAKSPSTQLDLEVEEVASISPSQPTLLDLGGEAIPLPPISPRTQLDWEVEAKEQLVTEEVTELDFSVEADEDEFLQAEAGKLFDSDADELRAQVTKLQRQKQALEVDIIALQGRKTQIISEQATEVQETLGRMVKEGLRELEQRKQTLELAVEQLERRRERVQEEMRTSFAGVSQDLAIRVKGFKDYLVGSLQDLAAAAEQLELSNFEAEAKIPPTSVVIPTPESTLKPQFVQQGFEEQNRQIQRLLEQYRTRPDYYGPPWQLRRTFEPIHAERVQNWFFKQGGRGAIRSMGSRLQNILIASTVVSVLSSLYGDRCRGLVLANSPERLGEWRRGLQDCLGISRSDFGPERGVVLFESPEALVQKADRLIEEKQMPLVIIDETEEMINLSLLQFPLWLAFAPDPQQMSSYLY